jgi:hypothetical protein
MIDVLLDMKHEVEQAGDSLEEEEHAKYVT